MDSEQPSDSQLLSPVLYFGPNSNANKAEHGHVKEECHKDFQGGERIHCDHCLVTP